MRTVTYGAACSLDGFITAGTGEALDWLRFTPDAQQVMTEYWSRVDAVLMGRKTWEPIAAQHASPATRNTEPGNTPAEGTGVEPSAGSAKAPRTYVFSRTIRDVPPGATLVATDAGEFVRTLKSQPGRDICVMGGSELAQSLFAADVIDEIGLNIHPVLLGTGVPLFRDAGRRVALELVSSRTMAKGCVLANYRVVR